MPLLELRNVTVRYGRTTAISNLSLGIPRGEKPDTCPVRPMEAWSMTMEGARWRMSSTSGRESLGRKRRAKELKVSIHWRWASV